MDEVKIRVLKNGPYEVKGAVMVTDQKRNPYPVEGRRHLSVPLRPIGKQAVLRRCPRRSWL